MRRHLGWALRLLFSGAVLAWLLRDGSLRGQLAALPLPPRPGWLGAGWLLAGLGEAVGLLRFWLCLQLAGVTLSLRQAAALHFCGLFTSLFLPGMAGGDALKSGLIALNFPDRKWRGLVAVVMERLSGFLVVTAWLALVAWLRADWFARDGAARTALAAVLALAGPPAAALVAWYLLSRTRLMRTRFRRLPWREYVVRCEIGFDVFGRHPARTGAVFAASLAGFASYFSIFHCAALAYRIPLAWQDTMSVMPLVDLITMLPVTIAGLGLREQSFQGLLAPLAGIAPAQGVVISLAGFLLGSTWALLGAPVFLRLRARFTAAAADA